VENPIREFSWANIRLASYSRGNRYIPYVTDCRGRDDCSVLDQIVGVVTIAPVAFPPAVCFLQRLVSY
jgi:hypothetical protein